MDLTLVPLDAGRVRIAHLLMLLWTPVRHLPGPPTMAFEVPIDLTVDPARIAEVLEGAFEQAKPRPDVQLREVTAGEAIYQLRFPAGPMMPSAPLKHCLCRPGQGKA